MASGHVNRTNRPNTWLHRPALRREDCPCQLRPSTHGTNAKSFDVRFVAGHGAKGTNSDMAEATR
jgi:hypothetical protein